MAGNTSPPPSSPVRISKVAGRYLIFDIDDVMYLRRKHNICAVFVGTIPQNPQQNSFMGLPLELIPEEAKVLVDKKVGYVVDDVATHPAHLMAMDAAARKAYTHSVRREAKKLQLADMEQKKLLNKGKKTTERMAKDSCGNGIPRAGDTPPGEGEEEIGIFDQPATTAPRTAQPKEEAWQHSWFATPTTSRALLTPAELETPASLPVDVPPTYPLYAHLHDKGYFMMPGLRFGCDYNVYPGDPLRFHSHFQATGYGWYEDIRLLDLVTGGRLGTTVKKGYLIGGQVPESPSTAQDTTVAAAGVENGNTRERWVVPKVRTFVIEWAAM